MPRKQQSKRLEALHNARWAQSSSAATSLSSTFITENILNSIEVSYS